MSKDHSKINAAVVQISNLGFLRLFHSSKFKIYWPLTSSVSQIIKRFFGICLRIIFLWQIPFTKIFSFLVPAIRSPKEKR